MSPFPAFSASHLVFHRLSSPSLQYLYFYHTPSLLSPPCRIYSLPSFPYLFLFFVLFLPSLCVAAAVRPCQDQVMLKSWQRQRCLASLADTQLEAVKLGFKQLHLPPQWRDGGTDERRDCWEQGRAGEEGRYVHTEIKVRMIWCASHCT